MSLCRWSDDDFQCDLYIYEDVSGGITTHVAENRIVFDGTLPPPVSFDDDIEAWLARHDTVMRMVDSGQRVKIGLPYDGETFNDPGPAELLERLAELREVGYCFPAYVEQQLEVMMNGSADL